MKKFALITAGGKGLRMGSGLPKQFLELAGKPMLLHAFQAFSSFEPGMSFVLVLPEESFDAWQALCHRHGFHIRHELVAGGPTRFHSVKNGLKHIPDQALVAIHDGARPLVSTNLISRVFHFAAKFGSAIPVVTPEESVRQAEQALSQPLPREQIRLVQTPQCFRAAPIKNAYNRNYSEAFTDDATVLEATGERIFLVEGEKTNIKITTPDDLRVAAALLQPQPSSHPSSKKL